MKKRIGQWAFIVAGIVIMVWGIVSFISPTTNCRGVEMGPGDVCSYSSPNEVGTKRTQTYEERIATARQQAPVGVLVGLGMAGFGGYLMRKDMAARSETD